MRSTGCSFSCESRTAEGEKDGALLRRISVMGKPIEAKGYICSPDGITYPEKGPETRLQLTICVNSACNCSCPFCIAQNTREVHQPDPAALEAVLIRLRDEKRIRGISLTGGEPFLDVPYLNMLVSMIFGIFGSHMEVSLSTNGSAVERLHEIRDLSYLDAVHISRHHYDDRINRALFCGPVPDAAQLAEAIRSVPWKDLFVLNCVLLQDGIGTVEDVHRYLDFAIGLGVPKTAFITAVPVNGWVRQRAVDYRQVLRSDDPALLFTRGFQDHGFCRCQDGIYVSEDGRIAEFYGRSTNTEGCTYTRGLVYTADDRLRAGFDGEFILQDTLQGS